ncbi:protein-L-isoaspartate O-methyltransferase family protein [Streptomyces sp. NPDC055287]
MAEPGHRVLELGTGLGWNAALLSARAGPGQVACVEADPGLAAAARERLKAVGAEVTVEVGDGAQGLPTHRPYERLIATYAVDQVPWPWVEQVRPGGRIVTPWGRLGHVALTVAPDGQSASRPVDGCMASQCACPVAALTRASRGIRSAATASQRPKTPLPEICCRCTRTGICCSPYASSCPAFASRRRLIRGLPPGSTTVALPGATLVASEAGSAVAYQVV